MKLSKVLIADSQVLVVAGIRHLLEGIPAVTIISEVSDWKSVLEAFQQDQPDIVIFDYIYLDGFSTKRYRQLSRQYPSVKFFAITADQSHPQILEILQTNTTAFLSKDCSRGEIINALQTIISGQKYFCETVLQLLMDQSTSTSAITPREIEIIQYIADELSTQEIANKLNLSPHTINAHRKRILKKLDVKTPIGLVLQALRHQLISL
ncbi:MAG: response regulator transcription factor [Bacteroidota bacterium]